MTRSSKSWYSSRHLGFPSSSPLNSALTLAILYALLPCRASMISRCFSRSATGALSFGTPKAPLLVPGGASCSSKKASIFAPSRPR